MRILINDMNSGWQRLRNRHDDCMAGNGEWVRIPMILVMKVAKGNESK